MNKKELDIETLIKYHKVMSPSITVKCACGRDTQMRRHGITNVFSEYEEWLQKKGGIGVVCDGCGERVIDNQWTIKCKCGYDTNFLMVIPPDGLKCPSCGSIIIK